MNFKKKISIIIPTVGKNINYKQLNYLCTLSIVNEIIIVVPQCYKNFNYKKSKKIKIIESNTKGQVHQRIIGFKNAKSDYVMQLDDDVKISNRSISNLIKMKNKLGYDSGVGPILKSIKDNSLIHSHKNDNFFFVLKKIFHLIFFSSLVNKRRMGKISPAGLCYGVDPNFMNKNYLKVEWIPGCCMIHHKKNLYLKNYFTLKSKAYCEDLIHSILLRKKGIKLYIIKEAFAYTYPQAKLSKKDLIQYNNAFEQFIKYYKKSINYYIYKLLIYLKIYIKN